jgi:hypothetical protein
MHCHASPEPTRRATSYGHDLGHRTPTLGHDERLAGFRHAIEERQALALKRPAGIVRGPDMVIMI